MNRTYRALIIAAGIVAAYALYVQIAPIIRTRTDQTKTTRFVALAGQMSVELRAQASSLARWQVPEGGRCEVRRESDGGGLRVWFHCAGDVEDVDTIRDQIARTGWETNLSGIVDLVPDTTRRDWSPPQTNVWVLAEKSGADSLILKLWVLDRTSGGIYFCMTPIKTNAPNTAAHGTGDARP